MNVLVSIIKFLANEVMSVPAYLLGIMAAIGLIAMRKSWGQVLGGFLKATLGYLILAAGAGVVIAAMTPLGASIMGATGAQGIIPTNEVIVSMAQKQYGAQVAWVMFLGFIISLILARFTPLHYVFLTGHHIFYMATLLTIILVVANVSSLWVVLGGAFLLATIMQIMPTFAHPWMKKVTNGEKVAIGHFNTLGYIVSGLVGQLVGKKSKSTEEIEFPEGLGFLRDPMISTTIAMILIYWIIGIIYLARAGSAAAFASFNATSTSNYIMMCLAEALQFGIGVAIILYGVRTILGEIVPAFTGIAEKIVPNALPALDCPITFPYAPNAVLIGFISSTIGGLFSLVLIALIFGPAWGLALVLPGMVPHFFDGGTSGVFGNATGGRLGAVLGSFVNGILITFLPAFLLAVLGNLGLSNTSFGDSDFCWWGIVSGNVLRIGPITGLIIMAVIAVAFLVLASWWQKRFVESGWDPSPSDTVAKKVE